MTSYRTSAHRRKHHAIGIWEWSPVLIIHADSTEAARHKTIDLMQSQGFDTSGINCESVEDWHNRKQSHGCTDQPCHRCDFVPYPERLIL